MCVRILYIIYYIYLYIYLLFTTEVFLEVAIESWLERDLKLKICCSYKKIIEVLQAEVREKDTQMP